jgi:phosphonoacetaldehyde hydrolase
MPPFVRKTPYTGPVQAIILDWAGTAVDYGCMGPAAVFVEAFDRFDITVTTGQARQFMGLEKKEHIRAMLHLPEIIGSWQKQYGREPEEKDVAAIYAQTEPMMVAAITNHCELIDGVLDFLSAMRGKGVKIGSSTGYTRSMMDVLIPLAAAKGYAPDAVFCSSDVPAGRPYPWMCYANAMRLEVFPMEAMIKIGDTISDIEEGLNAGMWTIGLTRSGNELGLSPEEIAVLPAEELQARLRVIAERYKESGAHYVAEGIWDCEPLVGAIEERLRCGERPL